MQPLLFILSTLTTVVITSAERDTVYCDVAEHKFFVEQWGQCKMCDRCPTGYGVPSPKTIEVDMHPVHGALSCLGCQRCVPGKTFSNKISFEGCQKCRNCTEEGLYEETPCTPTTNTKCTDQTRVFPKGNKNSKQRSAEVKQISKHDKEASESETGGPSLSYYITTVLVFVAIVPTVVFVFAKKRGLVCFKRGKPLATESEQESLNPRPTVEVVQTTPTSPSSDQCCIQISTVSDNNASVSISQEEVGILGSVCLNEDDLVVDGGLQDRVMTEQDIRSIYTELAPDNIYCELCRALGVPDNTIQIIKEEQRPNLKETAFQCLKKWLELKGRDATIREFKNGLRQIGKGGLVETFRQKNSG